MFDATECHSQGTISPTMADFATWLQNELDRREMTVMDLSRVSGIPDGALYHIRNRVRNVGSNTCTRIAKAFNMPVQRVYEAAGLLPPTSASNKAIDQISHMVAQLPTDKQAEVLEFVRLQVRLAERRGKNAGTNPERARAPR